MLPDKYMEPDPSSSDNDDNNIINVDEKHASTQRVCNMSDIKF